MLGKEEVYFNTVCLEICAEATHWLFIYFSLYSFNARAQTSSPRHHFEELGLLNCESALILPCVLQGSNHTRNT